MSPVEELEDLEGNCNTNSVGEPEDRIFFSPVWFQIYSKSFYFKLYALLISFYYRIAPARELAKFLDFRLYFIAVLLSEKVREAIRESCDVPKEYKNSASKTIDCLKSNTKSFGSSWSIYDYKNYGCYWMFDKIGFIKTASLGNTEITHYSKILQGTSSDLRRKSERIVAAKGSSAARIYASHKKIKVAPESLYFIAVLSSEEVREAICESSDVPKEYKNCAFKTVDCLKSSTKSFGSSWSIYDYKNYGYKSNISTLCIRCYWMFDKIGFIKTASLGNTEITHYSKILQGTSSDLRRKSEGLVATKGSSAARIDSSHKMLSSEEVREAICESNDVPKEYKNCAFKTVDCLKSSTKSFGSSWSIYDYKNYGNQTFLRYVFDKIGFIKTASLANTGIIHYCKILQGTPFNFNWLKESPVLWFFHHSIGVSYLLNLLTGRQVTSLIFNHTIL
ncbi:LOW QUALITY PROTEIN: U4/U6 small nuclear ribonucleoprotein Prp31 [Vespula maculifrons]|uniref:U4/U6 small nuclear ribonucleoprotein Prp31 n=1 Tax=Vespula maculifrons TaxID=7453 RepID=A0ABD2BPZ2_VESMC